MIGLCHKCLNPNVEINEEHICNQCCNRKYKNNTELNQPEPTIHDLKKKFERNY